MKRLIVVAVVVALVALAVVPLTGAQPWKHGHNKFEAVGTFVSVIAADPLADPPVAAAAVIHVKAGTKTVRALRGTDYAFAVSDPVKVWMLGDDGAVAKVLADVPVGAKVKIRGTIDRSDPANPVFTITSIKYHEVVTETTTTPPVEPSPSPAAL